MIAKVGVGEQGYVLEPVRRTRERYRELLVVCEATAREIQRRITDNIPAAPQGVRIQIQPQRCYTGGTEEVYQTLASLEP